MTCPLTLSCYRALVSHAKNKYGEKSLLVSDLEDSWDELHDDIKLNEPVESALRLRGFYTLKFMQVHILASGWFKPEETGLYSAKLENNLAELIAISNKALRRSVVLRGSSLLEFSNKSNTCKDAALLQSDMMLSSQRNMGRFIEMLELQRKSLNGGDPVPYAKTMGRLLGECMADASYPSEAAMRCMISLLQVTAHSPLRI
jgi:hypothetical protein